MLPAASVLGCNSPALLWPTESRPSSNLASSCVLPPISSRSRNAGILNRPHTGRRSCVDKTTKNVAKARGEKPSTGEHHQVAWPRRTGLEQFAGGWKERAPGVLRSGLGSDVRSDESRVSFRSNALTGGFDPVPRRHPCIAAAGPFATVVKIPNGKRLGYVEHFDTGEFDAAQNPVPILMFPQTFLERNTFEQITFRQQRRSLHQSFAVTQPGADQKILRIWRTRRIFRPDELGGGIPRDNLRAH